MVTIEEFYENKPIVCELCKRSQKNLASLQYHMDANHSDIDENGDRCYTK